MQLEFWEQRWNQNQIAFHLPTVNPYLIKFWPLFNLQPQSQVFMPLCGKSLDLAWLANQQYSVLGVECSEKAIKDFFKEQKLHSQLNKLKQFNSYSNGNINLLQGDFLKLDKEILADVSMVYDRASLIALPEPVRQQYVSTLSEILPESAEYLLVTLDYNQKLMSGPPFSVSHEEVIRLYKPRYDIEILFESDVLEEHQKFKERGLNYLTERVYRVTNADI